MSSYFSKTFDQYWWFCSSRTGAHDMQVLTPQKKFDTETGERIV